MKDFKTNLLEALDYAGTGLTSQEERYLDRVIDESLDDLDELGYGTLHDIAHDTLKDGLVYTLRQYNIDNDIDYDDLMEILNDLYDDGLDDTAYHYYREQAETLEWEGIEKSSYLLFNDIAHDAEKSLFDNQEEEK